MDKKQTIGWKQNKKQTKIIKILIIIKLNNLWIIQLDY